MSQLCEDFYISELDSLEVPFIVIFTFISLILQLDR